MENGSSLSHYVMQALYIMLLISMPPIVVASVVGVLVSIFQALTQIQEQTLSFAIKLVAVGACLFYTSGWMGTIVYRFAVEMFNNLPVLIK
ncbi:MULTISPECIES: type III secretion system export apparatus subunit SctS [Candidatus Ichthyocystis]|uniref:Type III secretion system protein S n=1 Tax=Candidatus Ichthyocystis hellenicum TaxID=1561003 RepID=A0A0S4M433_9BURK|nr:MULTISPECIES: type III secretion system export apparatus subunit SctS [Ichthyocystis]CUT17062.1 type III secretion system protein S [Candidatus Ichthyocystis hellenicum]